MKKIIVSIIVIGCLLASSMVSVNAFTIEEKTMMSSNEQNLIIKNIFNKNDFLDVIKKGAIYNFQGQSSTDLDGNIVPTYFKTWYDDRYIACWGLRSIVYNGYLYQAMMLLDYRDEWIGILKYNASDGSLCDFDIWTDKVADCMNMVILDDCLYVCGILYMEGYPVLLKYDISGDDITFEEYLTVPYHNVLLRLICADENSIYICGESNNGLLLQKYNTALEPIWNEPKTWDGPYGDECYGMTFYDGSIFLTGSTTNNYDDYNSFVLKFDSDGNLLEEVIGLNDDQIGISIKGYDGKIYVAHSYVGGTLIPNVDFLVSAYDTDLVNLWTSETYDYCNYDQVTDIVLVDDYIYMSGFVWGMDWTSFRNGFILKCDISNGEKVWWKVVDDALWTDAMGICADDSYLYLSGSNSSEDYDEAYILKCDFNGNPNPNSPDVPTITGKNKGKPGIEYYYTFVSTNPDGVEMKYFIDWGDTSNDTTDFYPSGQEVVVNHTWAKKGRYTIRAKAITIDGYESGWGTLSVKMPRNRMINTPFLLKLLEQFLHMFPILRYLMGL